MKKYSAFREKTTDRTNINQSFFQKKSNEEPFFKPNGSKNSFFSPSLINSPIQPKSNSDELPSEIQAKAESTFGENFTDVSIHKNSTKAEDVNALAFTQGNNIHFAPGQYNPDSKKGKELIGHELTHVVQQSQGKVNPTYYENGSAINNNKVLEMEADKMGQLIANDKGTETTSRRNKQNSQTAQGKIIQKYTRKTGKLGRKNGYNRLSDDGKLAVKDHGKEGYAEESMITKANSVLKSINSIAKVKKLSNQVSVPVPKKKDQENTLTQFTIVDKISDKQLCLTDDCGRANQEIMGSKHYNAEKFTAVYGTSSNIKETKSTTYHGDDLKKGGSLSTTEELSAQIYIDIFKTEYGKSLSREDALKQWSKLSRKKREGLNKKYGINEYATPEMGQGITIGSERDMPGAIEQGYNFHFGFSLMKSGHDYITLEDYASSGVPYYLDMYGPESKEQAWAQDSGNTDAMDTTTTTMVVKHTGN